MVRERMEHSRGRMEHSPPRQRRSCIISCSLSIINYIAAVGTAAAAGAAAFFIIIHKCISFPKAQSPIGSFFYMQACGGLLHM